MLCFIVSHIVFLLKCETGEGGGGIRVILVIRGSFQSLWFVNCDLDKYRSVNCN